MRICRCCDVVYHRYNWFDLKKQLHNNTQGQVMTASSQLYANTSALTVGENHQCTVLRENAGFSFFRQSVCHWSRLYLQSPMKSQESRSANWESAHQVASSWKGVSWAAVSCRSSLTLWPPRDTRLKNSSSSPPSLVEMWVSYLLSYKLVKVHV